MINFILNPYTLPVITGSLSLMAGIVYLCCGDWRHGGYWLSAAAIAFFVTV